MQETTTSENIELKVPTTIKALIEALIFAAEEPLTVGQIRAIYQGEGKREEARQLDAETIRATIAELNKEYEKADRPYRIVTIAGGYQFATRSEYAEWLGRLHREQGRRKLSQSGIETLAIIAYKQPITKAEIEKIRGVNCDYVLKTLLEKELVTVTGRAETVGRPLLYGTTKEFLKHFGLNDITDLPRPREIEEILGESQFETERRMLEAQAGAEAMKKEQEDFKSRLPHIPKKKADLEQKEARIVTRQRIREIRILQRTEEENPQQEKIEFPIENSSQEKTQAETPPPVTNASVQNDSVSTSQAEISSLSADVSVPEEMATPTEHLASTIPSTPDTSTESEREPVSPLQLSPDEAEVTEENYTEAESDEVALSNIELPSVSAEENIAEVAENQPTESASTPGSRNDETGKNEEISGAQPQKSRWKVWKEKIQGFIRKLFD